MSTDCDIRFRNPKGLTFLFKETYKLRNNFAHGDWNKVRRNVNSVSLLDSFNMITQLFYLIENKTTS